MSGMARRSAGPSPAFLAWALAGLGITLTRGAVYTARDQKALQQCADAVAEAISLWEGALRKQLQVAGR